MSAREDIGKAAARLLKRLEDRRRPSLQGKSVKLAFDGFPELPGNLVVLQEITTRKRQEP